jgi:hypothetical protein
VIWCVPLGICSLIIAKLGQDGNFWAKLEQLSVFVGTLPSSLCALTYLRPPCPFLRSLG